MQTMVCELLLVEEAGSLIGRQFFIQIGSSVFGNAVLHPLQIEPPVVVSVYLESLYSGLLSFLRLVL